MTDLNEKDLGKVQQALSFAYRQKDEMAIGHAWKNRVMARVRSSETKISPFGFMAAFEQYFWRLTPVATLALLVLGYIISQQISSFSDYETARVFMKNTWDISFSQLLGTS